jgi:hypothetical protein
VVQGTVQEFSSGYSLSRTSVRLVPVPRADNVNLKQMQQRTGPAGQFVFFNVPDGYYFLISTRNGYFPGAYGQRRPNGQGAPILVTKDSDLFAQLRMHRKGAITGRVLDENGVGGWWRRARRTIGACTASTAWTRENIGCGRRRTRLKTGRECCRPSVRSRGK